MDERPKRYVENELMNWIKKVNCCPVSLPPFSSGKKKMVVDKAQTKNSIIYKTSLSTDKPNLSRNVPLFALRSLFLY